MWLARVLLISVSVGMVGIVHAGSNFQPRKYAAMLMDYETGKVLYSRGGDLQRYPASLTKIMTLYMVFDALKTGRITMDQKFKASRKATYVSPSKLGLGRGEMISVENIIYALVTKSANDASIVIAEALGGTEADFARQMTAKARQIGMTKTTFRNASGLPNRAQVTTARDMATLGVRILKDFPEYYAMFNKTSFTYKGRTYGNHNKLLKNYQGTDGIKTGFINASGFNLVASVVRDNRRLIGVVFGGVSSSRRDSHMRFLLDKGFRVYRHMATRPIDIDSVDMTASGQNILQKPIQAVLKIPKTIIETPVRAVVNTLDLEDSNKDVVSNQPYKETESMTKIATLENTKISGKWGIQVGAYRSRDSAYKYAQQVMGMIPTLSSASIQVNPRKKRNLTIYQSRVVGLEKGIAQSLCRTVLDTTIMTCIVVDNGLD